MTVANNPPTGLEFQITDTKLYVPAVTLAKENDKAGLKSGFKKAIKWNKHRSQIMTIQNNNNNLNYLIDPTFANVNRQHKKRLQRFFFHIIMYQTYK